MKRIDLTKKGLNCIVLITIGICLFCSCGEKGVSIDEAHFPDKVLREYIQTKYDKNNDDILSQSELENLTSLAPVGTVDNLEGIAYLKNLEEIQLFDSELDKLDLSNNPNIKKINLTNCSINSDVDLKNNSGLVEINVTGGSIGKINIGDDQKLESVHFNDMSLDGLEITNCSSFEHLFLYNVDSIRSVNLDSCDSVKWISADKCESLEFVELGTAPKLYDVQILDCNVERLDITGCELMLKLVESSPEENERHIKYTLDGDSDTGLRPYNLCIDAGMTLVTE